MQDRDPKKAEAERIAAEKVEKKDLEEIFTCLICQVELPKHNLIQIREHMLEHMNQAKT